MKKLLLSISILSTVYGYAQQTPKKINIFNYTNYNLSNNLVGSNQANNCNPGASGFNSSPVLPGGAVSYTGYYNSHLQNPPILSWNVYLPGSALPSQPASSPILQTIGATTDWQMNKFHVDDPSGAPLNWSGASIGTISCNTPIVTQLIPNATTPWAFNGAFWFVVSGETYFVIQ